MNELPSRESFNDVDIETLYRHGFFDEEKIIAAYLGGRLVDRNAIDYGAVERVIREWNSYTPEAVTRFASELVAAMFGGSD